MAVQYAKNLTFLISAGSVGLDDVAELVPPSLRASRLFSTSPWHSPFAYPCRYLDKCHLDLLSAQLTLFGWLLSQGQLGTDLKVGTSEAVTWPSLAGEVVLRFPFPSWLGERHRRCPGMSCGWQLLLCWVSWAVPGRWVSRWRALGARSGWNCKIRDLGFICGYTVARVFNSRFLLKRADCRHPGWDNFIWLLSPSHGIKERAQTSICLKKQNKNKQAKKMNHRHWRCLRACFALLWSEALKCLSAATGFCKFNVCKRCSALVSRKALIAKCWCRSSRDVLANLLCNRLQAFYAKASAFWPSVSFSLSLETKCLPSWSIFQAVRTGLAVVKLVYPSLLFLQPYFLLCGVVSFWWGVGGLVGWLLVSNSVTHYCCELVCCVYVNLLI